MSLANIAVSVIIPTFNRLSFLKNTLLCLFNQQTTKSYEIIIVDSGIDSTQKYIKQISKNEAVPLRYKKIKHCTNRSLLRNKGAKLARGKLLVFLDNDILVSPNFIENIVTLHNNNDKVVVLGKRNSLTEFDINLFGKENLVKNFDKLYNLPAIRDDRELYLDDINITTETAEKPWRFLFSHSFCVSKQTYFEVGGFDKIFGNKWGCEDLELGYRLYNNGCKFILANKIVSFHQPHFSQSKKEQKESFTNNDLFIQKYPYADVELDLSLYKFFQTDYLLLKSIKSETDFSYIHNFNNFNYILGCIKDINDNFKWPKNCLLGTHIPTYNKYKKVLILKTIYKMNYRIKLTIISEAFRISDNVWFEKENNPSKKQLFYLYENFDRMGLDVIVTEDNNYYKVKLNNRIKRKYLALFLCDISNYEKRFIYLFLAEKFREKDWKVNIVDLRRKENEKGEDLILDTNFSSFDEYSYWNNSSIICSLNNKVEKLYKPLPGKDNYVFDDVDFPYSIHEQNICPDTISLDKSIYDMFAINTAFEKINEYKNSRTYEIKKEYDLCTFMLDGFYEDGIDIILETITSNKNLKVAIKLPDYDSVSMNCYPGHNEYSKNYKCSSLLDKKRKEEQLLKSKILEMNLFENVKLIKQNISVFEAFDFILKGNSFVLLNRGMSSHFLIYSSILLKQIPIVTEHSIFDERLKKYCNCVKTNKSSYVLEKHLVFSNENIMRIAQKIEINSFMESVKLSKTNNLKEDSVELNKIMNEYSEKLDNFLINF